ncbi:MAG: ATP-binding protein [Flavobacteriales bacterium]|nr:ATP-binding protein [Flavobacteriales bacterium]
MNSAIHVRRLIAQGEHQQLDFKYELNDSRKIARSLVAFANTDGGRLLVGVKDNGKITGIDSEEEMYVVEAAAQFYSDPEIPIQGQLHEIDGKEVLEIKVEASEEKHFVKEEGDRRMAYIRHEDMNLKANRVLLRIWQLSGKKKGDRFEYGEKEQRLFNYLKEHGHITFKKYCRITRQHYRRATDKLAKLVMWEVLDMDISEKGVFYTVGEHMDEALKRTEETVQRSVD